MGRLSISSSSLGALLLPLMLFLVDTTGAENNGLAITPPMGWNGWNCWASENAHEDTVLAAARVMATKLAPSYKFINLDCGWSTKHRDPVTKELQVNMTRFPHGMKWLGDQIHALGLKFGMYGAMGYAQCCSGSADKTAEDGSGPGCNHLPKGHQTCRNESYYEIDANLWASWGVDLVKFDGCGGTFDAIEPMRDALRNTGRPIVYSIHGQVVQGQMEVGLANFWRIGADIGASYEQFIDRAMISNNVSMYLNAGPGGWNDPDMLQVGNVASNAHHVGPASLFPDAEGRTQFALWCITKAPLLIGTFLHNISGVTLETVTNQAAISVNQDSLGEQGMLRKDGGYMPDKPRPTSNPAYGYQIWSGALSNGGAAAVLANLNGNGSQPLTLTDLEMPSSRSKVGQKWDIVEAFTGAKQSGVVLPRTVAVGPHDVAMWVLTPTAGSTVV